jgi:hypothetical protein
MVMPQLPAATPAAVPVSSSTKAVKGNCPALLGVPVITPLELFNAKSGGSVPELTENTYGEIPPRAPIAEEYATPTCPVLVGQAIATDGATIMWQCAFAAPAGVPVESVTVPVNM